MLHSTTVQFPKQGRPPKYPFETLEVGESFIIAAGGPDIFTIRNYCSQRSAKFGRTFKAAKLDDGSILVARVA